MMQLPARLGIKYHQQEQVNTTHSVAVRVKKKRRIPKSQSRVLDIAHY